MRILGAGNAGSAIAESRRGAYLPAVGREFTKIRVLICLLALGGLAQAVDNPGNVERLAFWAAPELRALKSEVATIDRELLKLPVIAGLNSGNRAGFQTDGEATEKNPWVEVELGAVTPVDTVVLVPLLAKGSGAHASGFGFPRRFVLEGFNQNGETIHLMDETAKDFPNPGLYPVSASCPAGTLLKRIRLTATEPWQIEGTSVLALSEILVLDGNLNMTWKAKVRSSSSQEVPPTWSRSNLVDMMTPLGLPLVSDGSKIMGWHGPLGAADKEESVTVDLVRVMALDEVRLVPAMKSGREWIPHYGFPHRYKVETALNEDFKDAVMVYDRTGTAVISPGQNLQTFSGNSSRGRYIRVTATYMRESGGNSVFALGELQVYSAGVNVAKGAKVVAGESLEDGEWSRAGLTDGLCRGGTLLELPEWFLKLNQRRMLEIKRQNAVQRRSEVFTRAEHTLVLSSVSGASGIILIAGVLSWRGRRQRVLDRERHRERLARDLHDELGSNLGSIALISSLAVLDDAAQMRLDLVEIELVARESADSMRDMVSLLAGNRGGVAADWLNVMTGLAERLMRGVELDCQLPKAPRLGAES